MTRCLGRCLPRMLQFCASRWNHLQSLNVPRFACAENLAVTQFTCSNKTRLGTISTPRSLDEVRQFGKRGCLLRRVENLCLWPSARSSFSVLDFVPRGSAPNLPK